MFTMSLQTVIEIVFRTSAVYLVVLIGLRLTGKREIGQMTTFDLVLLLLLSNSVQNAMLGPDVSLGGGMLAAVVLLVINSLVSKMQLKSSSFRHLVEGVPTLLVLHGEKIVQHMQKEGVDEETLMAALREHGVLEIDKVEMAVLEIDGSISVVPVGGTSHRGKQKLLK